MIGITGSGTDQRNGVSFDQEDGSAVVWWTGYDQVGAHSHVARHAFARMDAIKAVRCGATACAGSGAGRERSQ